jgi:hypothetical protein
MESRAEYEYVVDNRGFVTIKKYKGSGGSVTIPAVIDGNPVDCIGKKAFQCCDNVTHISLPEGITSIEFGAFSMCSSLEIVELPDSITVIKPCAFEFCRSLKKVILPKGITVIGEALFRGCSTLTDVVLPKGITKIDKFAFDDCWKLTNINVPQSLQLVEYFSFGGCESLRYFPLPSGVEAANDAFHDCVALGTDPGKRIPQTYECNGVFYERQADDTLFVTGCLNPMPYHSIKKSIRDHRTVKIMPRAFQNCDNLIEMVIPEGIREIGSKAFAGCSKLRLIELPSTVTHIAYEAIPNIGVKNYVDEKAAYWSGMQDDPWARKHYGLYDPIIVESKSGVVKVIRGSYAEQYCKENHINYVIK